MRENKEREKRGQKIKKEEKTEPPSQRDHIAQELKKFMIT